MTGTTRVPIDTRRGAPGAVPLPDPSTAICTAGEPYAPQAVVAYRVPGAGPQAIDVSTVNPSTDVNFDTVIAVRGPRCWPESDSEPPLYCFDDDTPGREARSSGSFVAEGGERIYIVVTGYGTMSGGRADEGLAQLDITAQPVTVPTIEEASVLVTGSTARIDARGGDAGRDAAGVMLTLHGPAGDLIDLSADGALDDDDAVFGRFDRSVRGALSFAETATVPLSTTMGASFARIRLFDRAGVRSERSVSAPIRVGSIVGIGAMCDGTRLCGAELSCDGTNRCAPTPERAAACAAPTAFDLMAPTDGRATVATRQGVLTEGAGLFTSPFPCGETEDTQAATGGREDLYLIRVPAGRFDVLLTTDSPGTAGSSPQEPDTVVYVRRNCADASAADPMECNDDIDRSGGNYRSELEIRDVGDTSFTVFVEIYSGAPPGEGLRYELAATLRPVLGAGMMCDPAETDNRCAGGPCPIATRMCP